MVIKVAQGTCGQILAYQISVLSHRYGLALAHVYCICTSRIYCLCTAYAWITFKSDYLRSPWRRDNFGIHGGKAIFGWSWYRFRKFALSIHLITASIGCSKKEFSRVKNHQSSIIKPIINLFLSLLPVIQIYRKKIRCLFSLGY